MSEDNTTNEDNLEDNSSLNHNNDNSEERGTSELGDTTLISGFYKEWFLDYD